MVHPSLVTQAKTCISSAVRQAITQHVFFDERPPRIFFHFSCFSLLTTESVFHIRLLPHLQGL